MGKAQRQQPRREGQIIPRGDRKWLVRVYRGRSVTGKRQYASKTVAGTFSQAKRELASLLNRSHTGQCVVPAKQTVQEHLTLWLSGKTNLSEKAAADYAHRLKMDVYPILGAMPLGSVSATHIEALYGALQRDRKLSARTIAYTHRILHQAFHQAFKRKLILDDPTEDVSRPKVPKSAITVPTPEDVSRLLEKAREGKWYVLWSLLLGSGLRPQEALALKWSDLEDDVLHVRRAVKELEKGKKVVSEELKTEGSVRSIVLPAETVAALQVHKARQATRILKAGPTFQRNDYIFAGRTGKPLDIKTIRLHWYRALEAAELPKRTLYNTRHTSISHLLAAGANVKAVAERHGHADASMTLRVYAHTLPNADRELAQTMDSLRTVKQA